MRMCMLTPTSRIPLSDYETCTKFDAVEDKHAVEVNFTKCDFCSKALHSTASSAHKLQFILTSCREYINKSLRTVCNGCSSVVV